MSMGGGGSTPQDNSLKVRELELADAEKQRAEQAAKDKALEAELAQLRNDAYTAGRGNAESYFQSQGLVPDEYTSAIERILNQTLASVPRDDPNPATYFNNVGQQVYDSEEAALRNRSTREFDSFAPAGFDTRRIADTADDPHLASIEAEQRATADSIVKNMLDRGVITNTGYDSALGDLNKQRDLVNARLNDYGQSTLASGRTDLREIANTGRQAASTLKLGTPFDPYQYNNDIETKFTDFMNNLGSNIRSKVTGNLYDTQGLAKVAGQAQGAQNTAFDPGALAGIIASSEDDEKKKTETTASSTGLF